MKIFPLNLRGKFTLSMLTVLLVSFLLTGAVTVYHFKNQNENYHKERLKRKETSVMTSIYYETVNQTFQKNEELADFLDEKICEIADINSLDIIIYSLSGDLILASNPALIDDNYVPETLSNKVKESIGYDDQYYLDKIEKEQIEYMTIYDFLYDINNEPIAIISLPYFDSNNIHRQDLEEFLKSLGKVYLLIFLGSALLSYLFSNYITSSLMVVREHIKSVRLNKVNEELQWTGDDEIGDLIKEYNHMVRALEKNAVQLAQSERASAWKEMAKQVAHEIKNPLTPMRLLVQYYQKTAKTEDPEKLNEFCKALIDQIDNLSSIASAFSQFGTLPGVNLQAVNLTSVLQSLSSLNIEVEFKVPPYDLFVKADKDPLIRVLNNVLKNAEQAIPEDRDPKISLWLEELKDEVEIYIKDNGVGIPKDKLEEIFEPNFTTKTQGMGLGLAMSKSIINNFKGTISADSNVGIGTIIKITLKKFN